MLQAIPLVMAAVCLAYGFDLIGAGPGATFFTAGHVVLFLAAICTALFCTAMTIIQQLMGHYGALYRWSLPSAGYLVAIGTVGAGIAIVAVDADPASFVTGFVIVGVGLISGCVSTVAAASTKFTLIPRNSAATSDEPAPDGFSPAVGRALIAVPVACSIAGVALAVVLLAGGSGQKHVVPGHVVVGLSLVCICLIALVATVVRQASSTYRTRERRLWPSLVLLCAFVNAAWGLVLVIAADAPYWLAPGWVMIGLSLVCLSILSKVLLLALVWRAEFSLANRIPLIPVATALSCLFLSAFLFQAADTDPSLAVPARVLVGLGAVCFTLFSIVSILESGTSG